MSTDPNLADLYESRRNEFTELLTTDLSGALKAANMFDDIEDRKTALRKIGFADPDKFVRPNDTAASFQDRLIQELGSKLLVEYTTKLLDRLLDYNVRTDNFPELKNVRAKCEEIREEMESRVSGKLDPDTGLSPAKYMVEFEYGIRPYEAWGKQELSDRKDFWKELMDWADRKRFKDEPVFCIEAVGGLGKSMLAWSWFQEYYELHKTDGKYDAYAWWSFYGHDAGFENFVNWALKGLGASDSCQTQEPLLDRIRRLNDILEAGGVVMVLDGVERLAVAYLDPQEREALKSIGMSGRQSSYRATREYTDNDLVDEDISEFFDTLRGAKRSRILTTSRVAPGPFVKRSMKEERGVILRRMLPLGLDFCVHLWSQINRNEVQWDRVRRLCEDVGQNSLLIRVLASAVAVTAGGLLDNWPTDDASQELLTTAPVEKARSRLLKYALDRISRLARLALKTFCAFPSPMKRELALKLVSDNEVLSRNEDPESVFDELASWALIGVVKNDGVVTAYDIHPIVRDHVRLSEVYRDPKDLAVLDNIYQAVPDPGTNQVRDVQDLNWAIGQFERAVGHGLQLNAWQVFRDRLETPLSFLGADNYIAGLLRLLFPDQRFSALPLVTGDRSAQGEILRMVATSAERLNVDVDTDRLWRWCLALQFLTQDASSWIKALDSRIALSVYSGRLAQCQDDIVLALSLAKEYNLRERNYSLYCFLGISLAFQGDKARSMKAFERAEESLSAVQESERTTSRRWVLQGRAEALVWLGDADGAKEAVNRMEAEGSSQDVHWGQRAWEEWTTGAADLMARDCLKSADKHLTRAANIAENQHYFLVMLLSLASRVHWALQNGQHNQAQNHVIRIDECDPHKRCLPAQVLVNLVRADAAQQANKPADVIQYAREAYRLAVEFRVYRAGVEKARNLLPPNLRNSHPDVPADPRSAVLALLDRDELPTVTAESTVTWWASHAGISARSRALADLSTEEVAARIPAIRVELQFDASDAVRNWWAQVGAAYTTRDQLLILEVVQAGGLPVEQIAQGGQAEPGRLTPVVGYCGQLRTLAVLWECEYQDSRVFRDLSIEDRRQWFESLAIDSPYTGLVDYQSKPGVAFDRVQFDRALNILTPDDYRAFIDDLRRKCCPDTDPDSELWWNVLTKHLPARDVLYFGEELVSLQLTIAGFLEGLEIDNPRNCRARLAAVHADRLRASAQSFTNTAGWSVERIRTRLEEVKGRLDWANTTGSARKWWEAFEAENQTKLNLVLRLAEELAVRRATVTDFFLAYVYSNTDNIQANLHYLDYTRLKKEEERKKKEIARALQSSMSGTTSQTPVPTAPDRRSDWARDPLASGFTNTEGWSEEQIRGRLEEVKGRLDWANTTGSARKWWEAFEAENQTKLNLVLRLAEELAVRRATVTDFFLAYVYSNTDNIQANLHHFDYTRLKKEHEQRKKEEERARELRELAEEYPRHLEALGLTDAALEVRDWWSRVEQQHADDMRSVYRAAKKLLAGGVSLQQAAARGANEPENRLESMVEKLCDELSKEKEEQQSRMKAEQQYQANCISLCVDKGRSTERSWWKKQEERHKFEPHVLQAAAEILVDSGARVADCMAREKLAPEMGLVEIAKAIQDGKIKAQERERRGSNAADENLRRRIETRRLAAAFPKNLRKLGLKEAGSRVRAWWVKLEQAHAADSAALHRFAEELVVRGTSAACVYKAARGIKAFDLGAIRKAVFGYPGEIPLSVDGVFDGQYRFIATRSESVRSLVVEAEHIIGVSSRVALKFLRNTGEPSAESLSTMCRREALTPVSCRHRHVVRLDDFNSSNNLSYLAMEYCSGGDLSSLLQNEGRLPSVRVQRLLLQAAEALAFIHATGVVHQQLNPRHILLAGEDQVRITDFSTAVLPGVEPSMKALKERMETSDYAAPELVEGLRCDYRSDLFSLGALFLEAATGRRWVGGVSQDHAQQPTADQIIAEMTDSQSTDSRKLAESLARAVAPQANDRWQSATEWIRSFTESDM